VPIQFHLHPENFQGVVKKCLLSGPEFLNRETGEPRESAPYSLLPNCLLSIDHSPRPIRPTCPTSPAFYRANLSAVAVAAEVEVVAAMAEAPQRKPTEIRMPKTKASLV
jgi:hypothetical protein